MTQVFGIHHIREGALLTSAVSSTPTPADQYYVLRGKLPDGRRVTLMAQKPNGAHATLRGKVA